MLFQLVLLLFLAAVIPGFSQTPFKGKSNWTIDPFENKEFIENKGQYFSSDILSQDSIYFSVKRATEIFFTSKGIVYKYTELKHKYTERQIERIERKGDIAKAEAAEKEYVKIPHLLNVEFVGANPNVQIIAKDQLSYFCSYTDRIAPFSNKTIKAHVFKRIIYKDVYPKIFQKIKAGSNTI